MIGRGVILHIDSGGFLFVANGLDDFGVVQVGSGDPPKLTVNGPVTVESGAQIEALGEGTQIQLSNVTLSNLGTIEAANLATITIDLKGDMTVTTLQISIIYFHNLCKLLPKGAGFYKTFVFHRWNPKFNLTIDMSKGNLVKIFFQG